MPKSPKYLVASTMLLALVAGCESTGTTGSGPSPANITAEEADLRQRQAALSKTLREGVAAGVVATTLVSSLFQNDRDAIGTGISVGAPAGLAAGSYVGALQQRYVTREGRLTKLRDDIQATNAQAEAAITAMRAVAAQQRQALATARATSGEATVQETASVEANLGTMRGLIAATEARRDEVQETSRLNLVPGQQTGVDAEVAALSQRIGTMREITELLAAEI